MVLLQRMPALGPLFLAEEMALVAPVARVIKAVVATVAALGAVNTMAGATPLVASSGTADGVTVSTGTQVTVFYSVNGTQAPPQSWTVSGSIPDGLNFSGLTGSGGAVDTGALMLSGTPNTPGTFAVSIQAFQAGGQGGFSTPVYQYTITVEGTVANVAPTFSTHPSSQTVTGGGAVTFSASASGTPAPTYQWRKDGSDIGGATSDSYTINSVSPGDAGNYTVVATNEAGSATSEGASLTVQAANAPPAITEHPQSQTITAGNSVTFSAAASGTPAPDYQWLKNNEAISGANGSAYTIANVTAADAGSYRVRASNVAGEALSEEASLTVNVPPTITQPLESLTLTVGARAEFTVVVSSETTASYQWLKDNADIPGETNANLVREAVTPNDAGTYAVRVSNAGGQVTSASATLTVNRLAQTITFTGPADQAFSLAPIVLGATADSALAVSLAVVSGPATLAGNELTLTGVGVVTLRATQAGDATYAAATAVERSFTVTRATAAVTLGSLSATYDGTAKSATATTSPAGLTVTFTYNGSSTAPTGAGNYPVVATVVADNYTGSAEGTLAIAKAAQTITFTGPANQAFSSAPITLTASASSGLPVSFSVVTGPASVVGATLTLTGPGSVLLSATQAGDANYDAAPEVQQGFSVGGNYTAWLAARFSTDELNNPLTSGVNADPDADGWSNLMEYALGLEPKVANTTALPQVTTSASEWVYTYTRPGDRSDVTYAVEASTTLASWTIEGVTHELASTDAVAGTQTWRARYPMAGAANAFFRLRATR